MEEYDFEKLYKDAATVIKNLREDVKQIYQVADTSRRVLVFANLLIFMHFGVLIAVHGAILAMWSAAHDWHPPLYSPINAVWGVFWIMVLVIIAILRGGWAVHGPFLGWLFLPKHKSEDGEGHETETNAAESVARYYIAFVAIEFIVNMIFNVTPFFGSPLGFTMFLSLLSAVPLYFLLRVLARQPIDWAKWVKLPLWNIYISGTVVFLAYAADKYPAIVNPVSVAATGWIAHPTFGVGTLFIIGVVLVVGSWIWAQFD